MKPFNLEEALKGKPVVTRDGRKARVVCSDYRGGGGTYPVIAILIRSNGEEIIDTFTTEGKLYTDEEADKDLFMAPAEPMYRPWKLEEVPLGCWLRRKVDPKEGTELLVSCGDTHIVTGRQYILTYKYLLLEGEHSTDGGKTWHPCGVKVEE